MAVASPSHLSPFCPTTSSSSLGLTAGHLHPGPLSPFLFQGSHVVSGKDAASGWGAF